MQLETLVHGMTFLLTIGAKPVWLISFFILFARMMRRLVGRFRHNICSLIISNIDYFSDLLLLFNLGQNVVSTIHTTKWIHGEDLVSDYFID